MAYLRKIINDPVYGFITIDHPLLLNIIAHPYYQRLRRINQMAFAHLVYPGAVHTRLHHSLGAYHLMNNALNELKQKGFSISKEEELGAKIAILLHDAGHGPYSHALEKKLVQNVDHEQVSVMIMQALNEEFNGELQLGIDIYTDKHPKRFLHQLVSGQLDVDRLDYLSRDAFFTGVAEGVIGYDRIIKMLVVHKGELMVEEKAMYSIEKFLIARRLMYWQVYLHKAVVSAEKMLVNIFDRARELISGGKKLHAASTQLDFFLQEPPPFNPAKHLKIFTEVDDTDIMLTIKKWCDSGDKVLSILCKGLVNRQLLKVMFRTKPFTGEEVESKCNEVAKELKLSVKEASYLVFTGEAVNTMYNPFDERIKILFKNGATSDISKIDNPLIHHQFSNPIKKYYLCHSR